MAATKLIPTGTPTVIDSGITAPAAGAQFSFTAGSSDSDFSGVFHATGTVTTLAVDLQVSLDGGTTWSTFSTGILTPAAPVKTITPLIAGALFRLNYTTASGSIAVSLCTN